MSSHPLLTPYLSNCLTVLLSLLHMSLSLYHFLSFSQFISLLSFFFNLPFIKRVMTSQLFFTIGSMTELMVISEHLVIGSSTKWLPAPLAPLNLFLSD